MILPANVILWASSWQMQGHDLFPSVLPIPSYPFVTRKGWEGHFYARECPVHEDQVDPCVGQEAVPMVSSRTVLKCFSKKGWTGGVLSDDCHESRCEWIRRCDCTGNGPENCAMQQHSRSCYNLASRLINFMILHFT